MQKSFLEINIKTITYFLITFFLIYGINLYATGFAIQYSLPLENNLNPKFQWVLESPIQFFTGQQATKSCASCCATRIVCMVHEQRRDHACPQCDVAFGEAGNLRKHVRGVHE